LRSRLMVKRTEAANWGEETAGLRNLLLTVGQTNNNSQNK